MNCTFAPGAGGRAREGGREAFRQVRGLMEEKVDKEKTMKSHFSHAITMQIQSP